MRSSSGGGVSARRPWPVDEATVRLFQKVNGLAVDGGGRTGVTDDSAFKRQVRARMAGTGENYTTARRMVIAARDPGRPPVALRVLHLPFLAL